MCWKKQILIIDRPSHRSQHLMYSSYPVNDQIVEYIYFVYMYCFFLPLHLGALFLTLSSICCQYLWFSQIINNEFICVPASISIGVPSLMRIRNVCGLGKLLFAVVWSGIGEVRNARGSAHLWNSGVLIWMMSLVSWNYIFFFLQFFLSWGHLFQNHSYGRLSEWGHLDVYEAAAHIYQSPPGPV